MRFLKRLLFLSSALFVIGCSSGAAADSRQPDNVVGLPHGMAIEMLDDYEVSCCDRSCVCDDTHHMHYQDARVIDQAWDGTTVTLTYYMFK